MAKDKKIYIFLGVIIVLLLISLVPDNIRNKNYYKISKVTGNSKDLLIDRTKYILPHIEKVDLKKDVECEMYLANPEYDKFISSQEYKQNTDECYEANEGKFDEVLECWNKAKIDAPPERIPVKTTCNMRYGEEKWFTILGLKIFRVDRKLDK